MIIESEKSALSLLNMEDLRSLGPYLFLHYIKDIPAGLIFAK